MVCLATPLQISQPITDKCAYSSNLDRICIHDSSRFSVHYWYAQTCLLHLFREC